MDSTKQHRISIARDFSVVPAGRYVSDGEASGEVFREKVLAPALRANASVLIDLDGTEGYGSSFLEEAFGGLIRHHDFTQPSIFERLVFKSEEDPTLIEEVQEYMTDAWQRKHSGQKAR